VPFKYSELPGFFVALSETVSIILIVANDSKEIDKMNQRIKRMILTS